MSDWLKQSQAASDEIRDAEDTVYGVAHDLWRTTGTTVLTQRLEDAVETLRRARLKVEASRNLALDEMLSATQDSFTSIAKLVLNVCDREVSR